MSSSGNQTTLPTIHGVNEVDTNYLVLQGGAQFIFQDYPDCVLTTDDTGLVSGVTEILPTQVPTTLRTTSFPSITVDFFAYVAELIASSTIRSTKAANQIEFQPGGSGSTLTLQAVQPATSRTVTLVDPGAANRSLLYTDALQAASLGNTDTGYLTVRGGGNDLSILTTSVAPNQTCSILMGIPASTQYAQIEMYYQAASSAGAGDDQLQITGRVNNVRDASAMASFARNEIIFRRITRCNSSLSVSQNLYLESSCITQLFATSQQLRFRPNNTGNRCDFTIVRPASGNRVVTFADPGAANRTVLYTDASQAATLGALLCTTLGASSNVTVGGDLSVAGAVSIVGGVTVEDLTVTDDLTVGDTLTVASSIIAGGNASIAGTLGVVGETTLDDVEVGGSLDMNGGPITSFASSLQLRFVPNPVGFTTFVTFAESMTANRTITFADPGAANRTVLYTNAAQSATLGDIDCTTVDATGDIDCGGTLGVVGPAVLTAGSLQLRFWPNATGFQTYFTVNQSASGNRIITFLDPTSSNRVVLYTDASQNATLGTLVCTTLTASSNATVGGTLSVTGATTLAGTTTGALSCTTLVASSNATVGGTLSVTGATTLAGTTTGALACTTLAASSNATVGGTLGVTGATTLAGTTTGALGCTTLAASSFASVGTDFDVAGTTTLNEANCVTLNVTSNAAFLSELYVGGSLGLGTPTGVGRLHSIGKMLMSATTNINATQAQILNLNASLANTYSLNTDAGDANRWMQIYNGNTGTGANVYSCQSFHIIGSATANRVILDLKVIRETSSKGNGALVVSGRTDAGSVVFRDYAYFGYTKAFISPLTGGPTTIGSQTAPTTGYQIALGTAGGTTDGNTEVNGDIRVRGTTDVVDLNATSDVVIGGELSVADTVAAAGDVTVGGDLVVAGATAITGDVSLPERVRQALSQSDSPATSGTPMTFANVNWCRNMEAVYWPAGADYIVCKIPWDSGQFSGVTGLSASNTFTVTDGPVPSVGDIIAHSALAGGVANVTAVSGADVTIDQVIPAFTLRVYTNTNTSPFASWRRIGLHLSMSCTVRQLDTQNHGVYNCTLSGSLSSTGVLDGFPLEASSDDSMPGTFSMAFHSVRTYQEVGKRSVDVWIVFTHGMTTGSDSIGALINANMVMTTKGMTAAGLTPYWTLETSLTNTYTTVVLGY